MSRTNDNLLFITPECLLFSPRFRRCEGLKLAVSRRSGDEIHPWLLNGDLRPLLAIRA